jgi:pyruvate/2-oxoglutarate/acetoin dehydrogenase E1 component
VEEGCLTGGVAAEIVSRVVAECFYDLEAPPKRVAAMDLPVPASPGLERAVIPDAADIARAAAEVVAQG